MWINFSSSLYTIDSMYVCQRYVCTRVRLYAGMYRKYVGRKVGVIACVCVCVCKCQSARLTQTCIEPTNQQCPWLAYRCLILNVSDAHIRVVGDVSVMSV